MSNTFTKGEARAFGQLLAGFNGSPRADLGTIRAKWKRNVVAVHDVPALLAQIKELARERDKLAILAELSDGYQRERDEALAKMRGALRAAERRELEALAELDEARAQLAAADTGSPCDGHRHCCADRRRLAEELLRVRAERDALKEKP